MQKTCPILIMSNYFKLTLHKSLKLITSTFIFSSSLAEKMFLQRHCSLFTEKMKAIKCDFLNCRLSKEKICGCIFAYPFLKILISKIEIFLFDDNPFLIHHFLSIQSPYFPFLPLPVSSTQVSLMASIVACQVPKFLPYFLLVPFR